MQLLEVSAFANAPGLCIKVAREEDDVVDVEEEVVAPQEFLRRQKVHANTIQLGD